MSPPEVMTLQVELLNTRRRAERAETLFEETYLQLLDTQDALVRANKTIARLQGKSL